MYDVELQLPVLSEAPVPLPLYSERASIRKDFHLVLLQLGTQVGEHVLQQFNRFIDDIVRSYLHCLPKVIDTNQFHILCHKATPPGNQTSLVNVYHTEETIKTPEAGQRKGQR